MICTAFIICSALGSYTFRLLMRRITKRTRSRLWHISGSFQPPHFHFSVPVQPEDHDIIFSPSNIIGDMHVDGVNISDEFSRKVSLICPKPDRQLDRQNMQKTYNHICDLETSHRLSYTANQSGYEPLNLENGSSVNSVNFDAT